MIIKGSLMSNFANGLICLQKEHRRTYRSFSRCKVCLMPGMKAASEEDKDHANQQYKQSDESETCLLLLHVIAVFDEDERRLVVFHAYR